MTLRIGDLVYWVAGITAGLLVLVVAIGFMRTATYGDARLDIAPLFFASVIWFLGWSVRELVYRDSQGYR